MAESKPKQPWMVNLSTFVAVCGSLAFGSCVSEFTYPWKLNSFVRPLIFFFFGLKCVLMQPGYSSPAQAAIRNDLFLTIAEVIHNSF